MSTTRTFQDMLNEYLPNELLKEEMIKRDYLLSKCNKDDNWKGGKLIVPFRGAHASSVKFGGLTSSSDISQSKVVRGHIDDYVECWGSLIFNHRDLQEHNGKIPESTFLKILPDEIDNFMDYMKMVVSIQIGSGPHFATVTDSTNAATGVFIVDRIDRFAIGQKVILDDDNSGLTETYVTDSGINVDTSAVTLSLTRGGAAANLSAYTEAQNAKMYHDGVTDGAGTFTTYTSLRSALLSAANGGDSSLHGVSKLAYPFLQAVNIDGSAITATNILDKLFDAYTTVRTKAKGTANTILMSYKHLGSIMKLLEVQKGAFRVTKEAKTNLYGWTELEITSVSGALTLVAIQEMDDDIIPYLDFSTFTFRSNGYFKKRKSPEGLEYFEVRGTSGYQYIVDVSLFGQMEWTKPGHNAIIHSISY